MHLVEQASLFPGACHLSGSGNGPFVDTGRHAGPQDERIYIQELIAVEIGEAVHMVRREQHLAALERIAELEVEVAELGDAREELERLEGAVRQTFAAGATRIKGDNFKLRPKPGAGAPRVQKEIVG
jgi:hypothetical protein